MLGTMLEIGMPPIDLPALTVRSISGLGVEVPMTHTLGTSRGRITKAPLFLIDVETAEGVDHDVQPRQTDEAVRKDLQELPQKVAIENEHERRTAMVDGRQ